MDITAPNSYRYYRSVVTEFFRTAEDVIRQESHDKDNKAVESLLGCSSVTVKRVKEGRQIESVRVAMEVLDRYAKIKTGGTGGTVCGGD